MTRQIVSLLVVNVENHVFAFTVWYVMFVRYKYCECDKLFSKCPFDHHLKGATGLYKSVCGAGASF